jgi:predicted nucleic acid-binding protein
MVFVDSNVPMYVAGGDHPLREPARRFLERARRGEIEICTSTEVLQEILDRYVGLGRPDLAATVYDLFVQLCPVVLPVTLADTDRARSMLAGTPGVSVRDLLHAAVMLGHGITEIATYDAGFDRIDGVSRMRLT